MKFLKALLISALIILIAASAAGCGSEVKKVKLDPENPEVVTIWHYYNGSVANAFDAVVNEFNETVGAKMGIIVEDYSMGGISELENEVIASANKEIGSDKLPNIFASYADIAYEVDTKGLLANLDEYITQKELNEYIDSYIEEGRIGANGELRIFPIAKSTEVLMLNDTDWLPFAAENGLTYDDLATLEGLTRASELYYNWSGGKAFSGRDSAANLFLITSKAAGTEIFKVSGGKCDININRDVMRKIWDNFYVPYISGYFTSFGKFRSDDAKLGLLLSYVGSTASAAYFPKEVTEGDVSRAVETKVLPAPGFEGADKTLVQQGAGMVVTKSTPQAEYASLMFLKWFTDTEINIEFCVKSGYTPVKKEAINFDKAIALAEEKGIPVDGVTEETLRVAFAEIQNSEMYTNKAFKHSADARKILENDLQSKASGDREQILGFIDGGKSLNEAVGAFNTDEAFDQWLSDFTVKLNDTLYR